MSAEMTSRSMPSRGTKYSFCRVAAACVDAPWLRGCLDMVKVSDGGSRSEEVVVVFNSSEEGRRGEEGVRRGGRDTGKIRRGRRMRRKREEEARRKCEVRRGGGGRGCQMQGWGGEKRKCKEDMTGCLLGQQAEKPGKSRVEASPVRRGLGQRVLSESLVRESGQRVLSGLSIWAGLAGPGLGRKNTYQGTVKWRNTRA